VSAAVAVGGGGGGASTGQDSANAPSIADVCRRYETPYLENMTLQGLLQLEASIPHSMLEAKVMRPNLAKSKSASDNRKLAAILGHLGTKCGALARVICPPPCAVIP
jgi:hypothetical protein